MKFRLIEFLRCPDHPESMLRVRHAQLSDVFPCSNDISSPVCRSGCGLYGNWFADIPGDLPSGYFLDCKRCLSTEIEAGSIVCPDCDFRVDIEEGVLKSGDE